MCGVVEIWARGSRGWKREEAEETRNFFLTRSGSYLGFKRVVLFSGGGGGVKEVEEWRKGWFSFFVLLGDQAPAIRLWQWWRFGEKESRGSRGTV